MLWHLILYPISRISRNPAAMQMTHLVIATLCAFVFLRFAPFGRALRALFVFGYFPFFEFATISRCYGLGILLLFIFCALLGKDFKNGNYIVLSVVLFFICQCSALAAVAAIALGITMTFEPLLMKDFSAYRAWRFYASIIIVAAGVALSVAQMIPPADSYWYYPAANVHNFAGRAAERISFFWNVFVPIPQVAPRFWETNVISYLPVQDGTLSAVRLSASVAILSLTFCMVVRTPVAAFYYLIGVVGITAFDYIFYGGLLRHKAHYYFVFISALWLGSYYPAREFVSANRFVSFIQKKKTLILAVVFSIGVMSAAIANTLDYLYPFSQSSETADYIKKNNLQTMPIAGHMDYAASAVAALLDKPFYYPTDDRVGTFMVWTKRRDERVDALKAIAKFRDTVKADVLLVLNDPPSEDKIRQYGLMPLKSFTNSVVGAENFYLYVMRYVHT